MALIFLTGFEENSTTSSIWTGQSLGTGGIVSTDKHSGTYMFNTDASSGVFYVQKSIATAKTTGSLFTRFYFKADDASVSANTYIWQWFSTGGVQATTVELLTTGALRLTNKVTAATSTTTTIIADATWYRVELGVSIDNAAGTTEMRLYSDAPALLETLTLTAGDTLPTDILIFRVGKSASTSTISYDDLQVNDDTADGTNNTTWCGIGKTYLLVPNSNVTNEWDNAAGGSNNSTFATIDDMPGPPDDSATYNKVADILNSIDRFGLTDLGAEVPSDAVIKIIDVCLKPGSSQTSDAHGTYHLWDHNGTDHSGSSFNCNVNGWRSPITTDEHYSLFDPTGITKSNIDSFNVGYENITDDVTRPRRVTAVWVNVAWTESTATLTTEYVGPVAMQRQGGVMIGRRYV